MQSTRYLTPTIILVAAFYWNSVYAAPSVGKDSATIEKLNSLDNKVELLQKQLAVKKLEAELRKTGEKKEPIISFPASVRDVLSSQDGVLKAREFIRKLPQDLITSSRPDLTKNKKIENMREAKKLEQKKKEREGFRKRIAQSRVTSITGFEGDLQAEIQLPDGGRLTVREGNNYNRIGKVEKISLSTVVLEKFGEKFFVPYGKSGPSQGGRNGR